VRNAFKGFDSNRLELLPRVSFDEYLELYARADVLLDVGPHNGHTTSIDALWQGVPVLTLAGGIHCARLGASLLNAIGLERFICESSERYVDAAVALEDQIEELANLRATMRDRLRASPLTDAARLARVVENAYRAMWRKYCAR
jgi:predicted O-linked N-acetylglucosamine transferase (SPINDLY family)